MNKNGYYEHFDKNKRKKEQICVNLYKHQVNILNELVKAEIYHNRSEVLRIALEFYLSNEYIQALRKNGEKIIQTIKNNNGKVKKHKKRLKL